MKIDFVMPWVNGNDINWQALRNRYCENPATLDESRYREWDVLKYWFRAVEKYAPWVDKIHFVTCGQWPDWLNADHPKLRLVDHKDYIPKEYLPTFNSRTIELNFHRIPDLAEHFVYFNDDMYLNAPVTPEDFFVNGLPCDRAVMQQIIPGTVCDPHIHAVCNIMALINTHFNKREVLKKNPWKWYNLKYGKGLVKSLVNTPGPQFSCFANSHIPSSMRRSTFEEVWDLEQAYLDAVCRNKFRTLGGVNQYIMSYYNLCKGTFVPRKASFGTCYSIGRNNNAMYRDIKTGRHKVICLNDHADLKNFEEEKAKLIAVFQEAFPEKSTFER